MPLESHHKISARAEKQKISGEKSSTDKTLKEKFRAIMKGEKNEGHDKIVGETREKQEKPTVKPFKKLGEILKHASTPGEKELVRAYNEVEKEARGPLARLREDVELSKRQQINELRKTVTKNPDISKDRDTNADWTYQGLGGISVKNDEGTMSMRAAGLTFGNNKGKMVFGATHSSERDMLGGESRGQAGIGFAGRIEF